MNDTEPPPLSVIALEVQLDRLDAAVADEWSILRPYYRWRIRRLRREVEKLRDDQIKRLLQTPFP